MAKLAQAIHFSQMDVNDLVYSPTISKTSALVLAAFSPVVYNGSTPHFQLCWDDEPLSVTFGLVSSKISHEDMDVRKAVIPLIDVKPLKLFLDQMYETFIKGVTQYAGDWGLIDENEINDYAVKAKTNRIVKEKKKDKETQKQVSCDPTFALKVDMRKSGAIFYKFKFDENGNKTGDVYQISNQEVIDNYFTMRKNENEPDAKQVFKRFSCIPMVKFQSVVVAYEKATVQLRCTSMIIIDNETTNHNEKLSFVTRTGTINQVDPSDTKVHKQPVDTRSHDQIETERCYNQLIIEEESNKRRREEELEQPEAKVSKIENNDALNYLQEVEIPYLSNDDQSE